MDEALFIVIALVICLGLIAGLYFVIDLLSQRVFSLACEARAREQREIVNHARLASGLNELIDEMTVLADALKNERILRSQPDAAGRVVTKKAAREAALGPPAPGADDKRPAEVTEASAGAVKISAQDPNDDADTRVLSRPNLQAATRPAARPTPTRVSAHSTTRGEQP